MKRFLQCVAEGYASRLRSCKELRPDDYLFVFPNKRAGTFFVKELRSALSPQENEDDAWLAPGVTTITDFTGAIAGRIVESRINLVFLLYVCYQAVAREMGAEAVQGFDAFRRWGETVLSDFNEVDMHLEDPSELFKNLIDFRNITSTFLTAEQREVIEEYFGYKLPQYDDDYLWQNFSDEVIAKKDGANPETRRKFIRLWRVLHPLYKKFNEEMSARGIATSGLTYRLAARRLNEISDIAAEKGINAALADLKPEARAMLQAGKIVFVGFNALSGAEREIFMTLKGMASGSDGDESLADFVWDATGPVICASRNSAGHFVRLNIKHFPAPEWLLPFLAASNAKEAMPEVTAIACPSKVAQVKIASSLLENLREEIGEKPFAETRVAMVIPDESLLLPMLYSMPENIENANLTMGYPLKLTSVTSLIVLLRRLQLMRRDSSKYLGYAYQEVSDLLSHPYAQAIIGPGRIAKFRREYEKRHISVVKDTDLEKLFGENGAMMLRPLPIDAQPAMVIEYLDNVLGLIEHYGHSRLTSLEKGRPAGTPAGNIERAHVAAWRDALRIFADAIAQYRISMNYATVMAEATRLLQAEVVPFEGEPLVGLQIMGLLETRALDFDHIIITSVNDKLIPMRSRNRSFLPNVIRYGYGLPPVNYSESIFSYYFYRLLSRARKVTLLYDNRASGLSGGVSRYLMQLRYLYARDKVREIEYRFNPVAKEYQPIKVIMTDELRSRLQKYCDPAYEVNEKGGHFRKNFSTSLLKRYLECPMKFYLFALENLKDDPEPSEGVDNITYGHIIHKAMEELYLPAEEVGKGHWLQAPHRITKEYIQSILDDADLLPNLLRKLINKFHYQEEAEPDRGLQPDTQLVAEAARMQMENLLRYDHSLAPFNIYGCEIEDELTYRMADGREVNVKYAIDRVDDAQCGGSDLTVRIVDYKTGKPHVQVGRFEDIFSGDYTTEHLFQLLFYTLMLNERRRIKGEQLLDVRPVIYSVPTIYNKNSRKECIPKIGKEIHELVEAAGYDLPVEEASDEEGSATLLQKFKAGLDGVLQDIFAAESFGGKYDPSECSYCPFSALCR